MRPRLWIRHLIVAAVVALFAFLGSRGTIGKLNFSRIEQWQVSVQPNPAGGLAITETIDLDLADDPGHGLMLETGTEFGEPQDLRVSSPDAPADVDTSVADDELVIRIGDPDVEIVGQHRYEVSYVLPYAPTYVGEFLSLDVMVGSPLDTDRFRATFVGIEFEDPACFAGRRGSTDPCELAPRSSGGYEVELSDLSSRTYITIEGRVVETSEVASPSLAPPPPRRHYRDQRLVGLATGGAALVGAALSYVWCRFRGRNQIFGGGGAADAAIPATPVGPGTATTSAVSDDRLASMATIEFEPPEIAPWEGLVLLSEKFIKPDVFNAYLSGLAGNGAIEIARAEKGVSISPGPNIDLTPPEDRRHIDAILAISNPYVTGSADPRFKAVYGNVRNDLHQRLKQRRWWRRTPRQRMGKSDRRFLNVWFSFVGIFLLFIPALILGVVMHYFFAVAVGVSGAVGLIVARVAYRPLMPSRTAIGSALALRTESFRRFLEASEAPQVEWAWEHDLVREYSGWAVALGEAAAWSAAIGAAARSQPSVAGAASGPLLIHSQRSSIKRSARTSSSSSGGSGGGSSSRGSSRGGSSGGGGGGSRAGRW